MTTIEILWRALLLSISIPLTMFVIYYAALSTWWVTAIGRILMGLAVAMDLMLLVGLSAIILGPWPGLNILRITLYASMQVGAWHLLLTLRKIQRTRPDGTVAPAFPLALFQRRPCRASRKDTP